MYKAIVTADWHLDRYNRLDDMSKCVDFSIEEAIRRKVDAFFLVGDGYRTWSPAPVEMKVMHRLTKLVEAGITVYIVVGNHDWPESGEYKGVHCFTEMKSLSCGIQVIDEVKTIVDRNIFLGFIPHIPKAILQETGLTYEEYFEKAKNDIAEASRGRPVFLFSHAYLREAAVGPNDLMIENDRQITLDTLKDNRFNMVALGDIHKHQVLQNGGPMIFYPGSLDRVDFGEAKDPKGIVYFEYKDEAPLFWEFVETPARPFRQLEIDLADAGEGVEIQEHLLKWISEQRIDGAVVKLMIKCSPEVKKMIDDKAVTEALSTAGAHKVRAMRFELDSVRVVRDDQIGEDTSVSDALERWVVKQKYDKGRDKTVLDAGRSLIGVA